MLEHQKIVLSGVGDHKALFRKELIKSMAWLNADEQTQLKRWVTANFYHLHAEIINDVLYSKYENASNDFPMKDWTAQKNHQSIRENSCSTGH